LPYSKQRSPGFRNGRPKYEEKAAPRSGRTDTGREGRPETDKRFNRDEKPRPYSDNPKSFSDKPRTYSDKPKSFSDKPRTYSDKPKSYSDKPKSFSDKPRTYSDKPKSYSNKPRTYSDKPKSYSYKPRPNSDKPGNFSERPRPKYERSELPKEPDIQKAVPSEENELPLILYGRNPVREALKSGRSIDRILVTSAGAEDGSLRELVRMARDAKVIVSEVTKQKLDEMTIPYGYAGKPANHQGIIARMPECQYVEVEDILNQAKEKGEDPFVIVLDSVSDPHNLGSIMRSALCAGAHGVIIPKRRAASVTAAAGKASAGAVSYLPVARVANLSTAVEELKEAGLWICGADSSGSPMTECKMVGPLALVIGGEDEGISRILKDKCDFLASIPMKGPLNSLNASVAAAVLIYEKVRQDSLR